MDKKALKTLEELKNACDIMKERKLRKKSYIIIENDDWAIYYAQDEITAVINYIIDTGSLKSLTEQELKTIANRSGIKGLIRIYNTQVATPNEVKYIAEFKLLYDSVVDYYIQKDEVKNKNESESND